MTHKRYENYVDTQEAWLDSHPSHWGRKPLWTLFRRVKRQGFESEELLSVYRDHGVIPKSSREDNFNKPSDDLGAYQLVEPGDLAVNKMKAWQGSVAISEYRGIVSPAYHVYRPLHSENQRFLHYLMRCDRYITGYLSISKGIRVNQWDLQPEYHSRMPVLLPPLVEQIAIASFLDRETVKIDTLIAEQQRLIDLLQEKRQAVISHVVTKGLNPNAPMKDSGVEWLGEVPEHWIIGKMCYYTRLDTGSTPDRQCPEYWNGDIPWVKTGEVRYEDIGETEEKITELALQETSCSLLQPGTLLMALYGQGVTRGRVGMLMTAASCNQACAAITPSPRIDGRYLELYLTNAYSHLRSLGNETTQQNLNLEFVGKLELLVPPLAEQECIWQATKQRTKEIDALLLQSSDAIALLQERRSALISAAVTGQIDVRGLATEEEP